MALGGEHGEGVVGGQSRGAERSARGAGAREQAPGVDGMEEMGKGMAAKDADVVLACGTAHGVTIEVYRVAEEMDPAIAHVRADQDGFGQVRVEVGEAACPLNAASEGGQVATVAGQPLGIIHEENPVQRARGGVGVGGRNGRLRVPELRHICSTSCRTRGILAPCRPPAGWRTESARQPPPCAPQGRGHGAEGSRRRLGRSLRRLGRRTRWCG